jgi:membrane peptidoglycan carboxypeptidase
LIALLLGTAVIGYYFYLASQFDIEEVAAPWHPDMIKVEPVAPVQTTGAPSALAETATSTLWPAKSVRLRYAGAVTFEELGEPLRLAIIAREDERFESHSGLDARAISRAAKSNLSAWSIKEGGSTITQQLARNVYQLRGRTLHRKLLEAMLAIRIERHYSKDQIITQYANRIYLGDGHWGVAAAAQAYFRKAPGELDLSQAAIIAGLIRSPNRIAPTRNPRACLHHRDRVLMTLERLGWITPEQASDARAKPLWSELHGR